MNIEPLEPRIAPAALVLNDFSATYTDVDGDLVTVKFSKPVLQNGATGILLTAAAGTLGGEQLQKIYILDPAAASTDITVTAKPQDVNGDQVLDGDGLVNVGVVESDDFLGLDLGKITIRGDLALILAGQPGNAAPGVKALSVLSLGLFTTTTGAGHINSNIEGELGALTVAGPVVGQLIADEIGAVSLGSLSGTVKSETFDLGASMLVRAPIGAVKIRGDLAGTLDGSTIASVTIGGSVTGTLRASEIPTLKIAGDVRGSLIDRGEVISSRLGTVTVGGSVIGGSLDNSGVIAGDLLGSLKIAGDLRGGDGAGSGKVDISTGIKSLSIGGSVVGGIGDFSGAIEVEDAGIAVLNIRGDLRGASSPGPGADYPTRSGYIEMQHLGSITIGGSIVSGLDLANTAADAKNGSIRVFQFIKSLTVKGSIVGNNSGPNTAVVISAGVSSVSPTDVAFGKITVGGSVEFARILAGFGAAGEARNADAQIGTVTVGADWIASRLIAGVAANAGGFGDADDAKLSGVEDDADGDGEVSKIASLIIKGAALGTIDSTDVGVFSIEAQHIVAIKVGGIAQPMLTGHGNDLFALRNPLGATLRSGGTSDFYAMEVA